MNETDFVLCMAALGLGMLDLTVCNIWDSAWLNL